MPKRDEKYMQNQRDTIARAALNVLIEKGYHETTLRDICRAANISNGALYSYFPTREAVVVAACAIDHAEWIAQDPLDSWAEYLEFVAEGEMEPGTYRSRRFRLSLQFVAALSQMDHAPEGLSLLFQTHRETVRRALVHLRDRGIIALPLGIEVTAELHSQLSVGAAYNLASNKDAPTAPVFEALRRGLEITAGLIASP